jgi:aryl-alcohol dehydrogenase-like predicted oxidoreductase
MTLWAYSPLLGGGYVHRERLGAVYDHPGTPARLTVLHEVARELEATVNQVVLAWLLDRGAVPIVGVSSVAQLEELLGATELTLDAEVRGRLDAGYAAAGTASARSRQ